MKADAAPILGVFERKARLEIPLYQRQYVWERDKHWQPLWEDIERKILDHISGRVDAPVHFLGAMVLDHKQTPVTHVEKRTVIDGQQRLTTLQIILCCLRDFCTEKNLPELASEFRKYTLNDGLMANKEEDKFKVWPSLPDRKQFSDVITSESRDEIITRHPLTRKKFAHKTDPRPSMIEAYLYFCSEIDCFVEEMIETKSLTAESILQNTLLCMKQDLKVVFIDLERDDDPQIIFETLNARGEPLLPGDLLRNYVFLRVSREKLDSEALYEKYWRLLDDPFWRQEIRQGSFSRPRSDFFIQAYLAIKTRSDISVKHLFVEYKFWIEKSDPKPFSSIEEELIEFNRYAAAFRQVIELENDTEFSDYFASFRALDTNTHLPLFMAIFARKTDKAVARDIAMLVESYVVRRALCALTTKGYTNIFIRLANHLQQNGFTAENARDFLLKQDKLSSLWPTDEKVVNACSEFDIAELMNSQKLVYILSRVSRQMSNSWSETIADYSNLSIEHIMPQRWHENWPLVSDNADTDELKTLSDSRDGHIHKIGNLTVLAQPLNSSISNSAWEIKRKAIAETSLLEINRKLIACEEWDESRIKQRSAEIGRAVAQIWPR